MISCEQKTERGGAVEVREAELSKQAGSPFYCARCGKEQPCQILWLWVFCEVCGKMIGEDQHGS